ncbi:MAG: succinate dehydrogenase, hydrophobic membrane anchor protein [Methylophilales bacterium]|nr:succinate dehydrogenase, hydrophobic membrane anchor protein [Methylophilales bacterium]
MLNHIFSSGYSGLRGWLLQRATALIMALYSLLLLSLVLMHPPVNAETWQALFAPLWMRLATMLFLFSLYLHAWLGVRDILKDYVQAPKIRAALQATVLLALIAYSLWTVNILWGISS